MEKLFFNIAFLKGNSFFPNRKRIDSWSYFFIMKHYLHLTAHSLVEKYQMELESNIFFYLFSTIFDFQQSMNNVFCKNWICVGGKKISSTFYRRSLLVKNIDNWSWKLEICNCFSLLLLRLISSWEELNFTETFLSSQPINISTSTIYWDYAIEFEYVRSIAKRGAYNTPSHSHIRSHFQFNFSSFSLFFAPAINIRNRTTNTHTKHDNNKTKKRTHDESWMNKTLSLCCATKTKSLRIKTYRSIWNVLSLLAYLT